MALQIRFAREDDAGQIRAIYAPAITDSAISFEVDVPSIEEMRDRVRHKLLQFPWLVAEDDGEVLGYVYADRHAVRAAYQWSVDVSVYVGANARRAGVARRLYTLLFDMLRRQGYRNAFAIITLPNDPSVSLHESLGFVPAGRFPNAGYKLGAWHDVGYWHLALGDAAGEPEPPIPVTRLPEWMRQSHLSE